MKRLLGLALCGLVVACNDGTGDTGGGGEGGSGGRATSATGTPSGAGATSSQGSSSQSTSDTSSSAATTGATSGVTTGGNPGLESVGTLVVLGDSIGDGGGQSPFYYNLLRDKLEDHYGGISYQRKAESGSKTSALVGQIGDLPGSLPGPVVVTITSGGNDMKAALPLIVGGADAGARATMGQNIDAALSALLEPGRFGPGVSVHVFEATIYDASDGVGDFGSHGCAFGQGMPAIPTDSFFASWNGVIAEKVLAHGQTLSDVHGHFYGHGYAGNPSWYASDCTHPNSLGHAQLADYFYAQIVGQ